MCLCRPYTFRSQLHDTCLLSERHQILLFPGAFGTQNYNNIAELAKKLQL